jgi:uncharacterized protein
VRTVPLEQVVGRIRAENPWWIPPYAIQPRVAAYHPRAYLSGLRTLIRDSHVRRAVLLLGPRRVGKTVLLHHVVQDLLAGGVAPLRLCMISVDHPLYNALGLAELVDAYRDAAGLDNLEGSFVCFDEIQYLPDWERHLKALVDEHPGTRFVASGSAAAALRLKSLESGAGRFTDVLLPPLSFHEYLMLLEQDHIVGWHAETQAADCEDLGVLNAHFINYLNFGGYPEVALSADIQADPARFLKADIIDKVLLRDLPSLYGIQDIQELNSLFTALAYNTAGEVSLEALAKRSGVAKNTLKRYIEYLEAAFLVKVIHRVDRDGRRFQRATAFKVYLTNPSMRAALFSPIDADDEAMGDLAETAVFAQWFHDPSALHYARWDRHEVDLVGLDARQQPAWAVEAKWSDRFVSRPQDLGSLLTFCQTNRLPRATVTTRTARATLTVGRITLEFIPTALYCYAAGRSRIERPDRAGLAPLFSLS